MNDILKKYLMMKMMPTMPGLAEGTALTMKMAKDLAADPKDEYNAPRPIGTDDLPPPAQPMSLSDIPTPPAAAPQAAPGAGSAAPAIPDLTLPKMAPAAPAPAPTADSIAGPEYNDAARKALYDSLREKAGQGLIGAGFAGFGDVISNAYGKGGQSTMKETMNRTEQAADNERGQFEAGRKAKIEEQATGMALRKGAREEADYAVEHDPKSPKSQFAQKFASAMFPGKMQGAENMSYDDINKQLPIVEKYWAAQQAKSDKAKKEGESAYEKARQGLMSVRGDVPLKNTEVQRDAAANAYNRIEEIEKKGGVLNPIDYTDILGQVYKARTGTAPTDTVLKHIEQTTAKGKLAEAYTYITGQQAGATTQDIMKSLKEMALHMGRQADVQHEGYMRSRMSFPQGISPEQADELHKLGRGYSFEEQVKMGIPQGPAGQGKMPGAPAAPAAQPYADAEKEKRYQAWKQSQGI